MQANQNNTIIDNIFNKRKDLDYIQDAVYPTFKKYEVYDPEVKAWAKISAELRGMGVDPGGPLPEQHVLMEAASKVGLGDVGVSDWRKVEDALLELTYNFTQIVDQISEFIRELEFTAIARSGGGTRKPSKRRKSSRRKSSRRKSSRRKSYKKRNTKKKKTKRRRRRTKRR